MKVLIFHSHPYHNNLLINVMEYLKELHDCYYFEIKSPIMEDQNKNHHFKIINFCDSLSHYVI